MLYLIRIGRVSVELVGLQAWALFAIVAICSVVGVVTAAVVAMFALSLECLFVPLLR